MSNLLNTSEGRNLILEAQKYLIRRRMSRFWKRNFAIEFESYLNSGTFTLSGLIQQMNVAHDPELIELYRLLGLIGGLDTTMGDMQIFVNAVTGSDVTGDGTTANPYASLWFFANLPHRIKHKVQIILQTSVTTTDNLEIDHEVSESGSLEFLGVGMPTELEAPQAATAWTSLGPGIFANLAVPFTARRVMEFAQITDGLYAGWAAPIQEHANLSIPYLKYLGPTPAATDSLRVIEPSITLSVNRLSVAPKGTSARTSGVVFANLIVVTTAASGTNIICGPVGITMLFAKLVCPNAVLWNIKNANVNSLSNPSSATIPTICACGVTNISQVGTSLPGWILRKVTESSIISILGNCDIRGLSGPIFDLFESTSTFECLGAEQVRTNNSNVRATFICVRNKFTLTSSRLWLQLICCTNDPAATEYFKILNSQCSLSDMFTWGAVQPANIIKVTENSQVYIKNWATAPAGATNDIKYETSAVASSGNWPAVYVAYRDVPVTSFVQRGST